MSFWKIFQRNSDPTAKFPWLWGDRPSLPELSSFDSAVRDAAQVKYLEAWKLDDEGELDSAIAKYSEALAIVPIFFEALDNRGLCYMKKHQFDKAISDFEMSARICETSSLALVALTECYKRTRQFKKQYLSMKETRRRWPDKAPFGNWDHLGPRS